jgi:hypothetical protein
MAYIRLKADKSNTINSYYPYSNQGDNTSIELYAKNISGYRIKSRGLFNFDFTDLWKAYQDGTFNPNNSFTAIATFYNMYSDAYIPPTNVIYNISTLTSDWYMGNGIDITTTGYSNWYQATNSSPTGEWTSGLVIYDRFTDWDGSASITSDFKNVVIEYLTGATSGTNYGYVINLDSLYESSTANNYDRKLLFSSKTNSIFYPRIDIVWKDKFSDDFKNLYFGSTGTIYFYNKQRGVYADLDGTNPFPGYFTITGTGINYAVTGSASSLTGVIITGVSGSRVSTGIYKFELPVIPYTYGQLTNNKAIWVITSSMSAVVASVTKPVTIHSPVNDESLDFNVKFNVSMVNFKERIKVGEKFQWTIYFRKESDIVTSLTAGSTAINSYIATDGYWKIVDERTGVDVYPWQEMNYNDTINFINFDTKYLDPYRPYRLVMKINEGDRSYYFDTPDNYFVFNTY